MQQSRSATSFRQLAALLLFFFPTLVFGQSTEPSSDLTRHTFSYSILDTELDSGEFLDSVRSEVLSETTLNAGTIYALWEYAEKPADAPFAGLAENQIGLMLAWPNETLPSIEALDKALHASGAATAVSTRMFEAIYLPAGLEIPTLGGFYVHREEKYSLENVSDAVRLSKEAWVTWEPHWGVTVIGLFREIGSPANLENLNRIVWYPSYETWMDTRNFGEDRESAIRFSERRGMLIPDSGIAIATDRFLH